MTRYPAAAALGLALDPARFPDPGLSLPAEALEAVDAALAEAGGARRGAVLPVAMRTAAGFLRDGRYAEAVHLADAAVTAVSEPSDQRDRLIRFAVIGMQRCRANTALMAFLDAHAEAAARSDTLSELFQSVRARRQAGAGGVTPHRFFRDGVIPDTLPAALEGLRQTAEPVRDSVVETILALRADPRDDPADFAARLAWGREMRDLLMYLRRIRTGQRGDPDANGADPRLLALAEQERDLVVLPDLAPITEMTARGRSVVFCVSHTGLHFLYPLIPAPEGVPNIMVAAGHQTDLSEGLHKRLGTEGDVQLDFMKAVKAARDAPHLVRIGVDGGSGGDMVSLPFMGRQIQLGPGACALAYLARAAVVYFAVHWRNSRAHLVLRTGPVAEKGMDRAVFERVFYGFYLDCLKDAVMGAPEDMVAGGGFWGHLKKDAG